MYIDEQSNTRLLFYIVTPMSFIVFMLSVLIILLLTKSNRKRRQRFNHNHHRKTRHLSSTPTNGSYTYTNSVLYRTNNDKLFVETKNQQRLFPIKSESSIPPIPYPVYSTSSHSLPSPSPQPHPIPKITPQPLSVRRLYKSYV